MKKLYFLFLAVVTSNAQVVTFTDANFKAKLLQSDVSNQIVTDEAGDGFKLDANNNSEIELSEALNVYRIDVNDSGISSLGGIENFTNLMLLDCSFNQLTSLDLTYRTYMLGVICSNNLLSEAHFPPIIDEGIDISFNLIETLQLEAYLGFGPGIPTFFILDCSNNPNLQSLFIKDAFIETIYSNDYFDPVYLSNCPNLTYICAKESDFSNIQSALAANGNTTCELNSYCTFNPGGSFYVIQGNAKLDTNLNGCDAADSGFPILSYTISNGTTSGTYIANQSGQYSIPVSAGTYTITPVFENPSYYTVTPATSTVTFPNSSSTFIQDFCISPLEINDLEVSIIPLNLAIPGFFSQYKIIYKNKGDNPQSGTISYTFDDSVMDISSTFPTVTSTSTNNLNWNFSNLLPMETREILLIIELNTSADVPPLNSGTVLNYNASITGTTDINPSDNSFTLVQTAVNSLDPNDKTCLEGATISLNQVGEYVHYLIRFENTGTANAQNVVIKDLIDTTRFNVSTLVPMNGSHPFVTRIIETNKVEFIFENIQLPFDDANNDGYVAFKIKTKPTLVLGNTFSNTASIYFDYNFPIVTNTYTTTIAALATSDFEFSNYFELAPNPTENVLNIQFKSPVELSSISIYNTLGQLVLVIPNARETSSIDVTQLTSGTYFVKVISDKGSSNTKFIKK